MRRIVCLGGGPAGLYAAILLRKALPSARIEVYERNRPDDTFGWGVVFSDETMGNFAAADPESHAAILAHFHHWDDIAVHFRGRRMLSGGHGFAGIGRKRLLNLLQERAGELGVQQSFEHPVSDPDSLGDADLIVAADGVNSLTRSRASALFEPDIEVGKCRFIWLGTTQRFDAFTFAFAETAHGWFQIHAYQFSPELSTVIVETREESWRAHGLDQADTAQSIAFCEGLFGRYLDGHRLQSNANHLRGSAWLNFHRVLCRKWHHGSTVLIGDAAHTAHFSIGSGTKLAMEDAIALAACLHEQAGGGDGLAAYEAERRPVVASTQRAAQASLEWFENIGQYADQDPHQFAFNIVTRSRRVTYDNLRLRDPEFVAGMDRWFAASVTAGGLAAGEGAREAQPRPPMFQPFRLGRLELANRVVVSPMDMYSAREGVTGDLHLVHL